MTSLVTILEYYVPFILGVGYFLGVLHATYTFLKHTEAVEWDPGPWWRP